MQLSMFVPYQQRIKIADHFVFRLNCSLWHLNDVVIMNEPLIAFATIADLVLEIASFFIGWYYTYLHPTMIKCRLKSISHP